MKILIIGSRGFIGHHLFSYFSEKNNEVWGSDVVDDYINKERYFLINATDSDYSSVFHSAEYDLCVNCSGAANVPDSLKNPLRDYYLNTVNVFKILEAIRKFQPSCKFINLSSAAVYGNPKQMPVIEDVRPDPISPYGFHKLQAEQVCKEFYDFYKIRTCSLRIFSVYGPGLKKQLFWDLYQKAQSSYNVKLFGTGDESRDFIYIADLAKAVELIINNHVFNGESVNIANGLEVRIIEAVSVFYNHFPFPVNFSFTGEIRHGDPLNWCADIRKLRSVGYKPSVNLNDGLSNYFNWLQSLNNK